MNATWRGQVIASSPCTLEVGGHTYCLRDALRMNWLRAAPKTADDRACSHGAQFLQI